MAKRIKIASRGQPRVRDTGPKQPRVDPAAVARALGAEVVSTGRPGGSGILARLADTRWCWREWSFPLSAAARRGGQVVEVTVHLGGDGPFRPTAVFGRGPVVRLVGLLVDGEEQLAAPVREHGLPFTATGDPFATPTPAGEPGCIVVRFGASARPRPEVTVRLKFERPGRWTGALIGALKVRE